MDSIWLMDLYMGNGFYVGNGFVYIGNGFVYMGNGFQCKDDKTGDWATNPSGEVRSEFPNNTLP